MVVIHKVDLWDFKNKKLMIKEVTFPFIIHNLNLETLKFTFKQTPYCANFGRVYINAFVVNKGFI